MNEAAKVLFYGGNTSVQFQIFNFQFTIFKRTYQLI